MTGYDFLRSPLPPHIQYQLDVVAFAHALQEARLCPQNTIPPQRPPAVRTTRATRALAAPKPKRRRNQELVLLEIQGCKSLLLEVLRRAAYDWVLYRTSQRLTNRALAESAYRWLFLETSGTRDGHERARARKTITAFPAICELLDLDMEAVRRRIRTLTPQNVMSVGRPAEYRRNIHFAPEMSTGNLALPESLEYEPADDFFFHD